MAQKKTGGKGSGLGVPWRVFRKLTKAQRESLVQAKVERISTDTAIAALDSKAGSDAAVAEATGRSTLLRAAPWVIGAVVVGSILLMRKKRRSS